jgi:arabinogalactan oligomer/maltooligosaccharide transport system substrate-binding protein
MAVCHPLERRDVYRTAEQKTKHFEFQTYGNPVQNQKRGDPTMSNKKLLNLLVLAALALTLLPVTAMAAPPEQEGGKVYTIQKDDWLSKIADKEYGDALAFPAIVYYNNLMAAEDSTYATIENPELIEPGWTVYVPTPEEATAYLAGEVEVAAAAGAMEPATLVLWTKEGEADGGLQYVEALADAYMAIQPNVTIDVVKKKDVEELREDFLTAGLAGSLPDLLWTVNDHVGPFTDAELILSVDDLVDLSKYVDSALAAVQLRGQTWGVPISNGNHLMLLYNMDLVSSPPANTDEMIAMAQQLTSGDQFGLVYNQTEPFWMVPWLGGFGGTVFADDGVTPTLNTPAMVATLQFLYDIKYTTPIMPAESDYNGAETLFKEGKAAMLINGDWSLGGYKDAGLNFGVARIPKVSSTDDWPHPYTSGVYFMLADGLEGAKLEAALDFISFATNSKNQAFQIARLNRLPGLKAALSEPILTSDAILSGSADQMVVGTPMPAVPEMRCNWDSMKPEMQAVLADTKSPEDAAAAMQAAAESCIASLQ